MKHLLLLLAVVFGLTSLPVTTFAKDKKYYDDDWKKASKDLRNDMKVLENHYVQVEGRVKYLGGGRRQWDELRGIRSNIDNLNYQLDKGRLDYRDFRYRVQQGHDDLAAVESQLHLNDRSTGKYEGKYDDKRRGGYYRPN
jgi:hypothetical protein